MTASATLETAALGSTQSDTLRAQWPAIRKLCRSTLFGAFATIAPDGTPQVTPIGSVHLDANEPRGYYHPIFTQRLRKALSEQQRFELLFVDGRATSWLPALVRGRFSSLVAVRLRGHALGARRETSPEEAARWQQRVRPVRWTRGYDLLWKDVRFVQELAFDGVVPVRFGALHP